MTVLPQEGILMAKEGTIGTEYLMPYEKAGADSPADAHESLLDVLASEDEATTSDEKGPEPKAEAEGEGEPEAEASVEGEQSEQEEVEGAVEEEPEAPPTYTVRVDGQELEVPLPELIAGYSRQSDYTRKTQELARERGEIRANRERQSQMLTVLEQAIAETTPKEPDWDTLRKENPAEYAATREDWRQRQEYAAVVRSERERVQREEVAEVMAAESAKLVQAIPEWKDETKAGEEKAKLVSYAASAYGWAENDVANWLDHRAVVVLRKAMLYDEMQAKGKEAIQEKITKPTKVLQPGGRPQAPKRPKDQQQTAIHRVARTGRVDDAAAAIEGFID